jgi:hypothetical protein
LFVFIELDPVVMRRFLELNLLGAQNVDAGGLFWFRLLFSISSLTACLYTHVIHKARSAR